MQGVEANNRVYTVVVNQDWLVNLVSILEKVINGHKFDKKKEIGHKLVINFAYGVSRVCHISTNSPFPSKSETVTLKLHPVPPNKSRRNQALNSCEGHKWS